ncbi:MAG: hypothetical protein U1F49_03610 [Rubrivivax sp.]
MASRFIAEMKLDEAVTKEDPRERLKRLRAELVARVQASEQASAASAASAAAGAARKVAEA